MSTHSDMVRMYNTLEKDTNDLGSTIHFDHKNFNTFGIRVYHLFFLACNLFEQAAKEIENNRDSNMGHWKRNPNICRSKDELIFIPTGFKFKPMMGLGITFPEHRRLSWWEDYNSVKHDLSQIHKATLRNLIYALGSAGILVEIAVFPGGITPTNPSILFHGLSIPEIH